MKTVEFGLEHTVALAIALSLWLGLKTKVVGSTTKSRPDDRENSSRRLENVVPTTFAGRADDFRKSCGRLLQVAGTTLGDGKGTGNSELGTGNGEGRDLYVSHRVHEVHKVFKILMPLGTSIAFRGLAPACSGNGQVLCGKIT